MKGFNDGKNKTQATEQCIAEVASLPIARTLEVQQRLLQMRENQGLDNFWLGLEYVNGTDGGGIWSTGEMFDPNEYDNFTDSRRLIYDRSCAIYSVSENDWRNHYCWQMRNTICMKWSQNVSPVFIDFDEMPQITGVYVPEDGLVLNGAPVYKLENETSKFYVYCHESGTGTIICLTLCLDKIGLICFKFFFLFLIKRKHTYATLQIDI